MRYFIGDRQVTIDEYVKGSAESAIALSTARELGVDEDAAVSYVQGMCTRDELIAAIGERAACAVTGEVRYVREDERMCKVVRYVSECDVKEISEPLPYGKAVDRLREHFNASPHDDVDYDIIDVNTGRFVSWVLSNENGSTGAM
jgi:hypothetical protein